MYHILIDFLSTKIALSSKKERPNENKDIRETNIWMIIGSYQLGPPVGYGL
jgi:hypothetical protein